MTGATIALLVVAWFLLAFAVFFPLWYFIEQ